MKFENPTRAVLYMIWKIQSLIKISKFISSFSFFSTFCYYSIKKNTSPESASKTELNDVCITA